LLKYWIALTDCNGLRIDTTGRNFCGTIREFAANQGKKNFFLVGEVAGARPTPISDRRRLGRGSRVAPAPAPWPPRSAPA
jgi:hypothetical protein